MIGAMASAFRGNQNQQWTSAQGQAPFANAASSLPDAARTSPKRKRKRQRQSQDHQPLHRQQPLQRKQPLQRQQPSQQLQPSPPPPPPQQQQQSSQQQQQQPLTQVKDEVAAVRGEHYRQDGDEMTDLLQTIIVAANRQAQAPPAGHTHKSDAATRSANWAANSKKRLAPQQETHDGPHDQSRQKPAKKPNQHQDVGAAQVSSSSSDDSDSSSSDDSSSNETASDNDGTVRARASEDSAHLV